MRRCVSRAFFAATAPRCFRQFPDEAGTESWQLEPQHKFARDNSATATSFVTACGRVFNPALYQEVAQACADKRWFEAVVRVMRDDQEYVAAVTGEGGSGADALRSLSAAMQQDPSMEEEEHIQQLCALLRTDAKAALSMCALVDAYAELRRRRDVHKTRVAATGFDPLAVSDTTDRPFSPHSPGGR